MEINVIGAGLAGSEAALQLAKRGFKVKLYEMRPKKNTGAHKTEKFAEAARNAAKEVQQQMAEQLKGVINA